MENNVRDKIMDLLKRHPEGKTILEISDSLGFNRNTITKYIYELSGAGIINQRKIGTAKLCLLVDDRKKGRRS